MIKNILTGLFYSLYGVYLVVLPIVALCLLHKSEGWMSVLIFVCSICMIAYGLFVMHVIGKCMRKEKENKNDLD